MGTNNDEIFQLKKIRGIMEYDYEMKVYRELMCAGAMSLDDYLGRMVLSLKNCGMIDTDRCDKLLTDILNRNK